MTITNKLKRNLKNKGDNCMSKNHRNIIIEQDEAVNRKPTMALIAHDAKKTDMITFVKKREERLSQFDLIATGATGKTISNCTSLMVGEMLPGPEGGDLQIGGLVASGKIDFVIFLRDPLTAHPHDPDISAILRVCDVHNIPIATDLKSAELLLSGLISKVRVKKVALEK